MKTSFFLLSLLSFSASACDLCTCYTPPLSESARPFTFSLAEQFTHFGTDREDGVKVANPHGERLDSSITQAVLAWAWSERFALQLNVPFIARSYRRWVDDSRLEVGSLSGLGDASLIARSVVWRHRASPVCTGGFDWDGNVAVLAGVKAPTGDSSALRENYQGVETGGIGAHDLALGSGSWDGLLGIESEVRYGAFFFEANATYARRTPGSDQYRFADDLTWSGGPGLYLQRNAQRSIALQCALSGETKGFDTFQGEPDTDSGATTLFVGPRAVVFWDRFHADAGLEYPIILHTIGLQTTPDYRLRVAVGWQF
jgi:hypothetical protein